MAGLKFIARTLRNNATNAERQLWSGLRRQAIDGFRFRRQVPLGPYVCDFVCLQARLIVEVDGATHSTEREVESDAKRDATLRGFGFEILRVTNLEVYDNFEGVLETIRLMLLRLRPESASRRVPSPLAREG